MTKRFTRDDASALERMRFYTTEKIGPKRSFTPEGFLLCEDVAICRTGEMFYGPGETPIECGDNGYVTVTRDESAVFHPVFLASFEGKPVTNDHPREEVNPRNWKHYAVGTVINPRRGTEDMAGFMVADLLITDEQAIHDIMSGKREVSCGYDAEYESLGRGYGRQYDMVGNHVALVRAGRCGNRCAIGDGKFKTEDHAMARSTKDRKSMWDRIIAAARAGDDAALEELRREDMTHDGEDPEEHIHIHNGSTRDEAAHEAITTLTGRMDASDKLLGKIAKKLGVTDTDEEEESEEEKEKKRKAAEDAARQAAEQAAAKLVADALAEEAPQGQAEAAKTAKDSSFLADSHQELVSLGEVLVPGYSAPTFDKMAAPKITLDAIHAGRKNVLTLACATTDGKELIQRLNGGKALVFDSMAAKDVRTLFRAAGNAKKEQAAAAVAAATQDRGRSKPAETEKKSAPRSLKDLNKLHEKHFGGAQQP